MELPTIAPGVLNIIASDFDASPMSNVKQGKRSGYEPAVTREVCQRLGLEPVWHNLPMQDFYTSLQNNLYDVIWFNQAVTPERQQRVDFTRPYGLFDEAVLVRTDNPAASPADLAGQRVGGLADSTNIALAATFAGVKPVPFPGSDKVLPEMLAALRNGEIDALIDDELVLIVPAETDADFRLAFSIPTRVPFAIGVRKNQTVLLNALNETLEALIADGTLAQIWAEWIPWKPFPFV
ncbi:MAG: amino acid ABC transporter substrate-binding protein [Microcoleus sp. SIO2G3]|nr:amino acid ABC transporter substrate-binding protein [Microcoleus sp. SIO2G3]